MRVPSSTSWWSRVSARPCSCPRTRHAVGSPGPGAGTAGLSIAERDWASNDSDLGYIVAHHADDALYDVAETHLVEHGATRLRSMGGDLERRGYEPEHVEIFSALEPSRVDVPAGPRSLAEF